MERKQIDWDAHFERFEASDLKATEYCRAQGLNLGTFRHKLYKFRDRQKLDSNFSEIMVNTEISLSLDEHGRIILSGIEPDLLPILMRAWSDVISQ